MQKQTPSSQPNYQYNSMPSRSVLYYFFQCQNVLFQGIKETIHSKLLECPFQTKVVESSRIWQRKEGRPDISIILEDKCIIAYSIMKKVEIFQHNF